MAGKEYWYGVIQYPVLYPFNPRLTCIGHPGDLVDRVTFRVVDLTGLIAEAVGRSNERSPIKISGDVCCGGTFDLAKFTGKAYGVSFRYHNSDCLWRGTAEVRFNIYPNDILVNRIKIRMSLDQNDRLILERGESILALVPTQKNLWMAALINLFDLPIQVDLFETSR